MSTATMLAPREMVMTNGAGGHKHGSKGTKSPGTGKARPKTKTKPKAK